MFAYRTGGGDLMLVDLSGNGSFSLWTPQRSLTLPTAGQPRGELGPVDQPVDGLDRRALAERLHQRHR